MNKIFGILLILMTVACSMGPDEQRMLFMSNTLQPDDILGEWCSVGKPYAAMNGGAIVVVSDTVIWKLQRPGNFIFDSLFFIKEFHSGSAAPNPVGVPQQSGSVVYMSGRNSDELSYGLLKFRMPSYDSLWVEYLGNWEYLARKH